MILLWLFKIGSVIRSVADFVLTHWKAFLLLAMVLAIFHYKTAYEREKSAYLTHLASDMKASEIRKAENKVKEDRHIKDVLTLMDKHDNELELIKNEYLKRTKKDSITIANLRSQLRDQLAADTSAGLPNFEGDASADSEVWRERYRAVIKQYETLKDACTITTSDFNACRAWADSACETVVCK